MHIVFVIDSLASGGAERSVAELLPFLRSSGVTASVVCLEQRAEDLEEGLAAQGFRVTVLRSKRLVSRALELRKILRSERADVVHTTLYRSGLVGRLAASSGRATIVTSFVGTAWDPVRRRDPGVSRIGFRWARFLEGWTTRRFNHRVHAISAAVAESTSRALRIPRERITVIERGRDVARLGAPDDRRRASAREALGWGPNVVVLLHVGRQDHAKGHIQLLRAFAIVHERSDSAVLALAGRRGHASAEIDDWLAHSSAARSVQMLGYRRDVPDLLAAADCFLFPSLFEGLGGAVLEAMALGLPVIASDIPALREVVEHEGSGLLVAPAEPSALADAIGRVLGDPELARSWGARGREIFLERFTLARSGARMLDLYRDAAG